MTAAPYDAVVSSGITCSFPQLSPCSRYVTHALLALSPLYSLPEGNFRVRLACFSHAASVRSEPGSNSSLNISSASGINVGRTDQQTRNAIEWKMILVLAEVLRGPSAMVPAIGGRQNSKSNTGCHEDFERAPLASWGSLGTFTCRAVTAACRQVASSRRLSLFTFQLAFHRPPYSRHIHHRGKPAANLHQRTSTLYMPSRQRQLLIPHFSKNLFAWSYARPQGPFGPAGAIRQRRHN